MRASSRLLSLCCLLGCLLSGVHAIQCHKTEGHEEHEEHEDEKRRFLLVHVGEEKKELKMETVESERTDFDFCMTLKIEHIDKCKTWSSDPYKCAELDEESHDDDKRRMLLGAATPKGHFHMGVKCSDYSVDCSAYDFTALTATQTEPFREAAEAEINEHIKEDLEMMDVTAHIEHSAVEEACNTNLCNVEGTGENSLVISSARSLMLSSAAVLVIAVVALLC